MPRRWPYLALCVLGCRPAAPVPPLTGPPPTDGVAASPSTSPTPLRRAPTQLQKTFTGQPQPSLVITNRFPIAQHLFIDWVHRALLTPAASEKLELTPGTHTITCADSTDPDDHPAAVTEAFDVGYAYVYELRPDG